ncbi:hypothetical protein D9758_014093 [Tetrapyrgos nigripes]|uniref:C-CAP/cofactor C-like domain-containing protein n=1 Tax=Tetrapyrgos nigripes TaxID=182062 RepID=A0A8H5CC17_9AGAR|nr:hypothetical protein D9758_014093 [Tetrapyrgos nigripes]
MDQNNDSKLLRDDPSKKWGFADVFLTQFQTSRTDLETRLNAAKETTSEGPGTVSKEILDNLSIDFEKISKSLRGAIGLIPKSDQGSCEAQLKGLEKSLEDLRKSSAPKSKFAFKRKPKAEGSTTTSDASTTVPTTTNPPTAPTLSQDASDESALSSTPNLTLSSRSKEFLVLHSINGLPSASKSSTTRLRSDLALTDLENCVINLITPPLEAALDISAVQIRSLNNCIVLLPKINGSVMVHAIRNCIVLLGCHQFRMHTSQNVDVYLDIRSNPVIEHCSGIRFASYPPSFDTTSDAGESSLESNLSVQDFSHIRSRPSPNWSLLSKDEVEDARLKRVKELVSSGDCGERGDGHVSEVLHSILPSPS